MGKTQQQQRSGSLQTRLNESPSTKKKKSYDSDHDEVGASGWQSCLVNGLINLSVRSSVGSRRRVTDRKELLKVYSRKFTFHLILKERACTWMPQKHNGGMCSNMWIMMAASSGDNQQVMQPGPETMSGQLQLTQFDFQYNFIQVWTGRGQSPEVEGYQQLFFHSKEQNTHCPRKGRIFLSGLHNFKDPFECEPGVEIRIGFM